MVETREGSEFLNSKIAAKVNLVSIKNREIYGLSLLVEI